ncbi:MAG: alkaline phosphatase family protein [Gemmatimonadota bacterium]
MTMQRGLFVTGALLLALAGCGETADTLEEAVDIAAEGGAKHLREPLRPAGDAPRVLVFALDGVGHKALDGALERGALPTLAALLGHRDDSTSFAHGVSVGPVLTVLPSITLAAWTTLFTGAPPGESGVPGNEWFDRENARFYAPAPVSVSGRADALASLNGQLMDTLVAAPTLFERADVRSYVSLLTVHRGADILALQGVEELLDMVAAFPEGAVGDEPVDRELYAAVDRGSATGMADLVRDEGPPDLGVVYFPGIDLYTHAARSPLAEQQRYLAEVTDAAMAEVLDAYRAAGALEGTYVIVTADHGHTPVLNDATHALGGDSAFAVEAALEEAGFRVRPAELEPSSEDHQAVLAWQGAFAYLSLADRSTCGAAGAICTWPAPPRWEEDVLPAARAVASAAESHPSSPLDLVILRRSTGPGESALFVLRDGEPVALDADLAASPRPELLAFAERLAWLTAGPHGDHAGDILLMTRLGASMAEEERYYFSGPYHSWHASAEAQDSHAPLLVARVDLPGTEIRSRMGAVAERPTQLDFVDLVLRLLERAAEGAAAVSPP